MRSDHDEASAVSLDIPRSSPELCKSNALNTQDRFSFAFATSGAYEHSCSFHPHMTEAIVVEAATRTKVAH